MYFCNEKEKVVVATTKIDIFKQITTYLSFVGHLNLVVVATTKIDIFKQITTQSDGCYRR